MEYVIVKYSYARNVFVDGQCNGETNQVLRVEEGTHRFDLGDNRDYSPAFHKSKVKNTTQIKPMVIMFSSMKEL